MTQNAAPIWPPRPRRSPIEQDEVIRKEQARLTGKNPAPVTLDTPPWERESA